MQNLIARLPELVDTPIGEYLPLLSDHMSNHSIGTWHHHKLPDMPNNAITDFVGSSYMFQQRCYVRDAEGDPFRVNSADVDREITIMNKVVEFHRSRELIMQTLENDLEGNK